MLVPYNFDPAANRKARDTDSLASVSFENGEANDPNNPLYRNTMAMYVPAPDRESQQPVGAAKNMPRSYSMPNVPVPPPMPPSESQTPTDTPSGTLKRNMAAAGTLAGESL